MSNRMRRFWRALGVGLVAVGCLFVAGQGGATAAPGDDDHKDNPGEISKNPKFPADDGPQPTAAQAELAERIAAIETNDSRDVPTDNGLPYQVLQGFVGITGSPTGGYTAILAEGVSSKAATSSAFAGLSADALGSLTLKESDVSVDEITSVWDAVASEKWMAEPTEKRPGYGMRVADARVVVELDESASEESRMNLAKLSNLVRVDGVPAMGRVSRYDDSPPHYGGAAIENQYLGCTAGFTVKGKTTGTYYSVTAGHCGDNGDDFDSGSYYYGEMAGDSGFPEFDMARLKNSTYAGRLWTVGQDNFDTRVVTGANDGTVGATVCQSGQTSSSICGISIIDLDFRYCPPDGCTPHTGRGSKSGIMVRGGDSGGPVYVRNTSESRASLRGIVIGDNSGTLFVWERYSRLSSHLNVVAVIP